MTATPTAFGRYRVDRVLGEGASGSVFVAHDEDLGREVAIKAIKPLVLRSGGADRFFNEARAIARLGHPNVVRVFDVGDEAGVPYLVMEMARGGSLKERLQRGPLPARDVRTLGIQMAHALAAAHDAGIVHRDIKPANILESGPGIWKLADFGVAHVPDSTSTITGQFLGSPAYAAPESLHSGVFGPASDIYGLASTLFEAATGRRPHDDRGFETRLRVGDDATSLYRDALGDADAAEIAGVISRGLAKSPSDRPSAAAFASLLASRDATSSAPAHALIALPPGVGATATTASTQAPSRPRWTALLVVAVVVLVAMIAAASGGEGTPSTAGNEARSPSGSSLPGASFSTPASSSGLGAPSVRPTRSDRRHKKHRDRDDDHDSDERD